MPDAENEDFKQREIAPAFAEIASQLSWAGREFYSRGWVYGTSGNFSAVIDEEPLHLAITSSGVDKSTLSPDNILRIDAEGKPLLEGGRAVAEAKRHVEIFEFLFEVMGRKYSIVGREKFA